jgi:hypothetical protein
VSVVAHDITCYEYVHWCLQYAFGFGLTYGQISYSKADVAPAAVKAHCAPTGPGGATDCGTVTVCVEVTNAKTAGHATEEVVQVYAAPKPGSVAGASLPKQMLLGFARTTGALQPGDAETVCIPLDLADMRLMGQASDGEGTKEGAEEGEGSFTLLRGEYTISVGGTSPGPPGRYVSQKEGGGGGGVAAPLELQLTLL